MSDHPYLEGTVYIVRRFSRPWSLTDEPGWNPIRCTLNMAEAEQSFERERQWNPLGAADIIAMDPRMTLSCDLWRREGYDDAQ